MRNTNNSRYTWFQYFFWLFSGSEISLLKNCPSDFNRHAGIGFTIFMTCLFGAFAGGYAGYYFTGNTWGAVVFGIIWGLLIFSIDRTMVVSLKKRPGDQWWKYAGQLSMRAILAGLIAFIISIPLELLVFKDNIDAGMVDYRTEKLETMKSRLNNLYNPFADSAKAVQHQRDADSLKSISNNDPQDADFSRLISESNRLATEIAAARSQEQQYRNTAYAYRNRAYRQDPQTGQSRLNRNTPEYREYLRHMQLANNMRKQANDMAIRKNAIDAEIKQRRDNHRQEYVLKAKNAEDRADSLKKEEDGKMKNIDATTKAQDSLMKKIEGSFPVRFDVLGYISTKRDASGSLEYPSVLFLVWLIRILFFVIEILPTFTKILTPFGAYDMAVIAAENDLRDIRIPAAQRLLKKSLQEDFEIVSSERKRQQQYRATKEGTLHDQLVNRMVESQGKVANRILEDWEKRNGIINPQGNGSSPNSAS